MLVPITKAYLWGVINLSQEPSRRDTATLAIYGGMSAMGCSAAPYEMQHYGTGSIVDGRGSAAQVKGA